MDNMEGFPWRMKLEPRLGLWYVTSTRCKPLEKIAIIAHGHYDFKSPLFNPWAHSFTVQQTCSFLQHSLKVVQC